LSDFWRACILGYTIGILAIPTGLSSISAWPLMLGAMVGMYVVVLSTVVIGYPLRRWIKKRWFADRPEKERSKWQKKVDAFGESHGVRGLGLIAPAAPWPVTIAGIALGIPRRPLVFWLLLGITIWTPIVTGIFVLLEK